MPDLAVQPQRLALPAWAVETPAVLLRADSGDGWVHWWVYLARRQRGTLGLGCCSRQRSPGTQQLGCWARLAQHAGPRQRQLWPGPWTPGWPASGPATPPPAAGPELQGGCEGPWPGQLRPGGGQRSGPGSEGRGWEPWSGVAGAWAPLSLRGARGGVAGGSRQESRRPPVRRAEGRGCPPCEPWSWHAVAPALSVSASWAASAPRSVSVRRGRKPRQAPPCGPGLKPRWEAASALHRLRGCQSSRCSQTGQQPPRLAPGRASRQWHSSPQR